MSIIINTDFCGDWAGEVYADYPNCPQNQAISGSRDRCVDFVGNNPQAFTEAYWDFNSIRVYQMPVGIEPTSSYSTSLSTSQVAASTNTIDAGMGQTSSSLSSVPYTGPLSSLTSTPATSSTSGDEETSTRTPELPDEWGFFTYLSSTSSPVLSLTRTISPELPDESGFVTYLSSTTSSPFLSTPYPSASPGAEPGAACPEVDKQPVTAADGRTYRVYCSSDTNGIGAFAAEIIKRGTYNQCFEYYTRESECTAFTWAEFDSNDGGECYLKREGQSARPGGSNLISVILVMDGSSGTPPTGSGSATTGATSSRSLAPSPTPPRFNCVDGSLATGPAGRAYTIFCDSDTTGGAFASQLFPNGTYSQRITLCDATNGCDAWTWGPYSTILDAGGNCFLKLGSQTRSPTKNPGSVGGSLLGNSPPPTSSRITIVPPGSSASASEGSSTVPVVEAPSSSSSAKPAATAVPCPAANGTEYVSSSGKVYKIMCGMDQESDASSSVYVMGDYSLCVAECEKQLGCVSITHSRFGPEQGFCYFRKSMGRLVVSDDSDTHLNLLPGRFSSSSRPATNSATTASSSRLASSSSGGSMSVSASSSMEMSTSSSGIPSGTSSLSSASTDDNETTSTKSDEGSSSKSTTPSASPSSATSSSSGLTAPLTSSLTSGTSSPASISTTSSAIPPSNTPQCDQVFKDPSGISYLIFCSTDSSEGAFRTVPVYSGGYGSCFGACDSTQGCGGFTFVGEQSGNCYLKSRPGTLSSTGINFVSAFRIDVLGYSSTSRRGYTSTSSSSSVRTDISAGSSSSLMVSASVSPLNASSSMSTRSSSLSPSL
jgi:hypothetical protein